MRVGKTAAILPEVIKNVLNDFAKCGIRLVLIIALNLSSLVLGLANVHFVLVPFFHCSSIVVNCLHLLYSLHGAEFPSSLGLKRRLIVPYNA